MKKETATKTTRNIEGAFPADASKTPLYVIVSLDVEEEGLFSGHYPAAGCGVRNVALLPRLAPFTRELGFPLTLFCAYTVFDDADARRVLAFMRDKCGAEIAAHLHHWSTPPLRSPSVETEIPERTHRMRDSLLRQCLDSLLTAGRQFQGAPLTSFRMGRWDLKSALRPLLGEFGITLDSSVCPLRAFGDGADHFLAPADPYWVDGTGRGLLESPVTQITPAPWLARLWHKHVRRPGLLDSFHCWGAVSANPVWHGEGIMRLATRLHVFRGGRVLHLFWHSSEMLPGASPSVPDQAASKALLKKIRFFLQWLKENFTVSAVTAAQLRSVAATLNFPGRPAGNGDW
ncbi:MAG: hypothetical protein LBB66_05025 [Desulfovibrio sp.]|jgi:hypothetical protein|nr:hypothetical protein [Desulfovibrio sp.]